MRFFDQKEEVLDIQLTQHGKRLLANGDFAPVYYGFFDNDIIYDGAYSNRYEQQNLIDGRIRNETPRLKSQYTFKGASNLIDEEKGAQASTERSFSLGLPLGNSSLKTDSLPAWQVDYLFNDLTASAQYITGSGLSYMRVPQLNSSIVFEAYVTQIDANDELKKNYIPQELQDVVLTMFDEVPAADLPSDDVEAESSGIAIDNTVLQVRPDFLLLEIAENNTQFLTDNFEIEVFEVDNKKDASGNSTTFERPLEFFNPELDEEVGPQHVEYYLNIEIDKQIQPEFFCASKNLNIKSRSRIADNMLPYSIICPEYLTAKNLYTADVQEEEEPC